MKRMFCWTLTGAILAGGAAVAQSDLSLEQAVSAAKAAGTKAEELKTKMDIAVVDAGANLKAFARMDGAWLGSIDIAIKKAKTARYFDMNTGEIGKLSQPGQPLYGIEVSNGGLISFPGGVPLKNAAGEIIGAIGVSGSTVENDHAVALAGAAALGGAGATPAAAAPAAAPAAAAMPAAADKEKIKETVNKVKQALETKNVNLLLDCFSEHFSHPKVGSKAEAKAMLQTGLDSGYADNGKVSLKDLDIQIKGDTAKAYPLDLSSPAGSIAVELTLKKEGDKWLITTLDVDGL